VSRSAMSGDRMAVERLSTPSRPALRAGNDRTFTEEPASPHSSTALCACRGRHLFSSGRSMARRDTRPGRVLPLPRWPRGCARGRRLRPPRDDARARDVRRLPSSSPFPQAARRPSSATDPIDPRGDPPSGSVPGHPPVGMSSALGRSGRPARRSPPDTCRGPHVVRGPDVAPTERLDMPHTGREHLTC
jgi:hypothetical protein